MAVHVASIMIAPPQNPSLDLARADNKNPRYNDSSVSGAPITKTSILNQIQLEPRSMISGIGSVGLSRKDKKLNENFTEHYEVSDQIKDLNRPIYNRLDTASDDALFHVMNKIKSNEFSNEQCMAFFFLKLNTLANLRSYNEQLDKYLDMYFNFFSSHTEILDVTNFTDLRNWDQFYKENFEVIPNQSLKFFEPWNIALRYCMISEQIMIMIFAHKNGNFSILPRELIRYVINTMIFCPEILSPGYMISSATKSALSSSISAVLTWIWPK